MGLIAKGLKILKRDGFSSLIYRILGPRRFIHRKTEKIQYWGKKRGGLDYYIISAITYPILILYQNLSLNQRCNQWVLVHPESNFNWRTRELPSFRSIARVPNLGDAYHGTFAHRKSQEQKYSCKGFVEFEPEDTVVDAGAYVGGLSLAVAPKVETVVAVDPFAAVNSSLNWNTRQYENVSVVPKALWNENTWLKLNLSSMGNENSIIEVDSFGLQRTVSVPAVTVDTLSEQFDIEKIDFLKVEAEGVEPEILEGVFQSNIIVRKISVDCSPERDGSSPKNQVIKLLKRYDYDIRENQRMVFAKIEEDQV